MWDYWLISINYLILLIDQLLFWTLVSVSCLPWVRWSGMCLVTVCRTEGSVLHWLVKNMRGLCLSVDLYFQRVVSVNESIRLKKCSALVASIHVWVYTAVNFKGVWVQVCFLVIIKLFIIYLLEINLFNNKACRFKLLCRL